jgi:pyridoxal phosphate enzyme (YggS family)
VIARRVAAVRERIARAAARAGRPAEAITLIAVSKTQPAEAVSEAFAAGLRHFGENKVQEAEGKVAALSSLHPDGLRWHMIGHVQSNKGRRAAELFDAVDSLDDATLARRLERGAEQAGRHVPVLVQVDLGNEET